MTCQPRSMPKRASLALPVKSQVGVVVVGEVVVVVVVEVFFFGDAPGAVVAFVEGAGVDGEGGDADAGEEKWSER
jgi:hypothetical protein